MAVKWSQVLMKIQAVVADAEPKQITDRAVKLWLKDLRDLAYDLDDLLDEIATEALTHKLNLEPGTTASNVRNFIPTCCTNCPSTVALKIKMGPKIEEITARLEVLAKQKDDLDLRVNLETRSNREKYRLPTTSLVDESQIYGRENDKNEILKLLLRDESHNDKTCVIPIVGMGGVGKTTLAQLVYNNEKVDEFFDMKAWVCVSEDFDISMITSTIYESVTNESRDFKNLNSAQQSLKEKLFKRKFLLVLDDVWNENYEKWDLLRAPFQVGLPGSKIVVTTRNEGVASTMGSVPAYHLKELADADCLSLLAQHALGSRNLDAHPNLEVIGMDIVRKCQGLPLAAKTLGGLLRTKHSPNEWKDVLDSEIWDLPEHKSGILPVLRLSYHDLPAQLKQMFAYCAIFPKDYEFDRDELVLLWMAEGFLQQSKRGKCMEEFGGDCFNELLSRSFFQRSGGAESKFRMHDLLNDLAQYVAGEICFRLDDNKESNGRCKISQNTRHTSFIHHQYEVYNRFKAFHELQGLRTFLPLAVHKSDYRAKFYLSNSVLHSLLPKLQCLRVLSLKGYHICELPNSIGDLKHLRYLNLSETSIKWLPESVSTLYNLQTLSLRGCSTLCKLPKNIGNLVNLRHLDNANTALLEEMPLGIGKLTSLQTLSKIFVSKSNELGLRDLNNLLLLQGMLSIVGLQNVMDERDAEKASLNRKQNLVELELIWSRDIEDPQNEGLQVKVLDMLRPYRELKSLKIEFYGGITFPRWIGDPSFSKTVHISLRGCTKCVSLPPLGQLPVLKELHIHGMHAVRSVGVEFYRDGSTLEIPFRSLEILRFEEMLEWEEWSCDIGVEVVGHFPRLRELAICNCPRLVRVSPLRLLSLRNLQIENCEEVVLKSLTELTLLASLYIQNISGLTHLQKEFISPLQRLVVRECPQLVYLLEEDQRLPCNLEFLEVFHCKNLKRLPNVSLQEVSLPPTLRHLLIRGCSSLESLPNCISHLEDLILVSCWSLRSLPMDTLPSTLKSLHIVNCLNLESVIEVIEQNITSGCFRMSNWPNLERLRMSTPNFEICLGYQIGQLFPRSGMLTPNLRSLSIGWCANLISFACHIESLTSLEELIISNCEGLESFPDGNLPPNLTLLSISKCKKLKPLSEWGLHRASSLQHIEMSDVYPELLSFEDEFILPVSLKFLQIASMPNLESLSKAIHHLTSLEHLQIYSCPKLRSLPNERTLAALSSLIIYRCPLLNRRSLKEKGDWPKIIDIPYVDIYP
ncbi:unnamed protein product [Ilex paraguariensis]|uniref:Disease resistance RPP13-like protein 1 n=1 Tax=Ilex paraguariensis TaxID=185542 RepID=A0ABC8RJB4_9AQUA